MARSVLLQLARDSIQEVIEAKRTIDKFALLKAYPILGEAIKSAVTIKLDDKIRSKADFEENAKTSLIDDIVYKAKVAAFLSEKYPPITTAEYLHCVIELSLFIPNNEGGFDVETSVDGPIVKD